MTLHVLGICLPGSFAARPPSPRAPGRYGYALVQLMVDACCTSKGGWYCRAGMPRAGTGGGGKDPPYFEGQTRGKRVAAHLLPGLVVTGLAADVEVDELRALNLTRDA